MTLQGEPESIANPVGFLNDASSDDSFPNSDKGLPGIKRGIHSKSPPPTSTIAVTNLNDSGPGSLRQAISDAVSGDIISFSLPAGSIITLTTDELLINKDLTINGPGESALTVQRSTVSGTPAFSVFRITAGDVTVSGLKIANGNATGGLGGGIANSSLGTVNIIDCVISANSSTALGGGIHKGNSGTMNIHNSTIFGNSSEVTGGGISISAGNVNITNSTFTGNSTQSGGGIYSRDATVGITNTTVSGNSADNGGGINCQESSMSITNATIANNGAPFGGGFFVASSTLTIANSIIALNTATSAGPDVFAFASNDQLTSHGHNLIGNNSGAVIVSQPTDQIGTPASPINPLLGPLGSNGGLTQTRALLTGSPALDKGASATGVVSDQRGFQRPVDDPSIANAPGGNGSDIGAFEAQSIPSPTPSPTATPTPTPTPATINSISPPSPPRNNVFQNVTVIGSGFQPGLSATIFFPAGGGSGILNGSQIQNVTANSFSIVVLLDTLGTHGIRVNNPDGGQSNIFNFSVIDTPPTPTPSPPPTSTPGPHVNTVAYTYDSLNRLTSVAYASGESINYSYDPAGNRTSLQATGSVTAVSTSTGTNVTVHGGGATITFATVTSSGVTTIVPISPSSAGILPVGYQLSANSIACVVGTTATAQGLTSICFNLTGLSNQVDFAKLRILQLINGSLQDVTTSLDFNNRTICASATTLGTFVLATSSTNAIDTPRFFAGQHYKDFLNRPPDAAGLAFWSNEIESCGTNLQCIEIKRINVSAAFFLSIEFQETGYLVYRMFKTAYGDTTSPNVAVPVPVVRFNDFLPDAQRIGSGVRVGIGDWQAQLEANKNAYAQEFVVRQRFLIEYPLTMTPAQFVDKLNLNAGGVLSQSERDQLVTELTAAGNATKGRASVLRKVAEDAELRQRETNRAFVLMQYYGYMRRNPDDPQDIDFRGWEFWLNKLNQFNGNFVQAEMVKAFIISIEYRQRFGP